MEILTPYLLSAVLIVIVFFTAAMLWFARLLGSANVSLVGGSAELSNDAIIRVRDVITHDIAQQQYRENSIQDFLQDAPAMPIDETHRLMLRQLVDHAKFPESDWPNEAFVLLHSIRKRQLTAEQKDRLYKVYLTYLPVPSNGDKKLFHSDKVSPEESDMLNELLSQYPTTCTQIDRHFLNRIAWWGFGRSLTVEESTGLKRIYKSHCGKATRNGTNQAQS